MTHRPAARVPTRTCPSCHGTMFPDKHNASTWTCGACGYGLNTRTVVLDAYQGVRS